MEASIDKVSHNRAQLIGRGKWHLDTLWVALAGSPQQFDSPCCQPLEDQIRNPCGLHKSSVDSRQTDASRGTTQRLKDCWPRPVRPRELSAASGAERTLKYCLHIMEKPACSLQSEKDGLMIFDVSKMQKAQMVDEI